jgi:lipid-A-disaccharide synthase
VVKELIQDEMSAANIVTELKKLLDDPQTIERIGKDYAELKDLLSHGGNASEKAAEIITGYLKNPQPSTANG